MVLEGPNGCGKTTIATALAKYVQETQLFEHVEIARLPGFGSQFSSLMRSMLVEKTAEYCPHDEVTRRLLYWADQREFILQYSSRIHNKRYLVILDRYTLSTWAYALYNGMEEFYDIFAGIDRLIESPRPGLQVLLLAPPKVQLERMLARPVVKNKDITYSLSSCERLTDCYRSAEELMLLHGYPRMDMRLDTSRMPINEVITATAERLKIACKRFC